MKIYTLDLTQRMPISIEAAWDFFSTPANLPKITPLDLGFTVTSQLPEEMYAGLILIYRVKPILGIPMKWVTELTHVRKPHYFADEQRFGPYKFWHHQHFFREVEGGVEMRDLVHYALPGGPLGQVVHAAKVKGQLQEIFGFRRKKLVEMFGEMG